MAENLLSGLGLKGLKTWQKVAIVGGGLGVAGLAYYESKKKSTAATTAANATAANGGTITDPASGDVYSDTAVDPDTGEAYEMEIDDYGSVATAEATLGGENVAGDNSVATVDETPVNAAGAGYSTNAQWSQAVTSGLSDIGYSATDIATALGVYLAGRPLTPDQQTIVYDALAEYGPPPVGTFGVIAAPNTVSSSGAVTGTTVTSSTSGGHVVSKSNNDAVIAWTPHGPATQWRTTITGPGPINGHVGTTSIPQATFSGLSAGHTYDVKVQPLPSGTPGTITIVTTK